MANRKPRSELSPAYRRRIERAEAKARKEGVEFSRKKARGKSEDEYKVRKEREQKKAGRYWPLRPAQIAQLKSFGATDDDLNQAKDMPQAQVVNILRNQKRRSENPKFKASWTIEEMIDRFPDAPPVMFYYHAWR